MTSWEFTVGVNGMLSDEALKKITAHADFVKWRSKGSKHTMCFGRAQHWNVSAAATPLLEIFRTYTKEQHVFFWTARAEKERTCTGWDGKYWREATLNIDT